MNNGKLYSRDYQKLDKFRLENHFNMAWDRALYERKQFKLDNVLYPFIPVTSKTELGFDDLWAVCPVDTILKPGDVIGYDNVEWLVAYSERVVPEAYKKFLLHRVADYVDVELQPQPLSFLGKMNSTGGSRINTFVQGFLNTDSIEYYAICIWPKNEHTQKIKRYFQFRYAEQQWQVDTVYSNLLEGVIVATIKQVPLNNNADAPDKGGKVEEVTKTKDYIIKVKGDTNILIDSQETYTWSIEDKLTGEQFHDIIMLVDIVDGNNIIKIDNIDTDKQQLTLSGHEIGQATIRIFNKEEEIEHTFRVEVVSLW